MLCRVTDQWEAFDTVGHHFKPLFSDKMNENSIKMFLNMVYFFVSLKILRNNFLFTGVGVLCKLVGVPQGMTLVPEQ